LKYVNKEKKHSNILKDNWFIYSIALKSAPFTTIYYSLSEIINFLIIAFRTVYLVGYIANCIQYQKPFLNVLIAIIIMIALLILNTFFSNYHKTRIYPKSEEKIKKAIRFKLYQKAKDIDLACYDNPEFYNDFVWSMSQSINQTFQIIHTVSSFFASISSLLIVGIYVLWKDAMGFVFVSICVIGNLIVSFHKNEINFQFENRLLPLNRKRDYISRIFYLNDYAKEIRLSEIKTKLFGDLEHIKVEILNEYNKSSQKLAVCDFLLNYCLNTFMYNVVYMLYLMYKSIVLNKLPYGTILALYNSCFRLRRDLLAIADIIPRMQQHSLYISKMRKFLNYESKLQVSENPKELPLNIDYIEFRNVSFEYQEGQPIIKNINMVIHAGEKIAIVGHNGSGKTTLVKLLMRLYDPTQGEILLNGINIKEFNLKEYQDIFSVLFQDYQIFSTTIEKNITVDNIEANEALLDELVIKTNLENKLKSLEYGYQTEVSKEFSDNGTELSGGEKQKLAMCRCLYRDRKIMILDEPSSALDPNSEYHFNQTMFNLSKDKTIVFISHRLSTTSMADCIYVMEDGKIIEKGNHAELMNAGGKYKEMYSVQAEKYKVN